MSSDGPNALPLPLAMAIVDRSVTVRGSPRRAPPPPSPSPPPSLSVRGQQRLIRQAIVQAQVEAEERDALRMSAEEYRILHDSFKSVKAEFSDLDGLSWDTPAGREMLARWHAQQAAPDQPPTGGVPMRRTNAAIPAHSPVACTPATSPVLDCSQQDTVRPSRSLPTGASLTSLFASLEHHPPSLSMLTHSPATEHDPSDDTVRFVPVADSRRSSTASTIVPDRDGARTPLPALFASLDKENEVGDVDDRRPALPKSHSAPSFTNPFADDPAAGPSRPTRPLPPSRIPVRSKSLSAKPTPALDASFVRRHASSGIRRVLEPRALLTASMVRNPPAPAPAPADAAPPSPSPAKRTRPSLPEPEPEPRPEPPRRAPPDLSVRSGPIMRAHRASGSKFRIVSAPPLRTIPTRPPAPAPAPEPVRAGPDSPLRVLHVSRPRVGGVLVAVVEPGPAGGKRGRALDDTGDGHGLAGGSDVRRR